MADLTEAPAPRPVQAMFSGPVSQQPGTSGTPTSLPPADALLGNTPVEAANTGGGAISTMKGVDPALATTIAKAITLGMIQAPQSNADWAKLIDQYSTPAGRDAVDLKLQEVADNKQPAAQSAVAQPSAGGGPQGLNSFLAAIRQHESGGNYQAYNAGGGASGAYQFIQSTWSSEANAAGYGQYAGKPAGDAPPQVQDAVAAHMAQSYYQQYGGNWSDVAQAWYDPALVGKNVVPAPGAGNTESVTAYGQQIVQMMGQNAHYTDAGSPSAGATSNIVKIAQGQIGVPYVWGGEAAGKAFDCSGLVQWVYGQAGETLPRVAQAQYDATPKIASYANLQPGDLLFFGSGPKGVEHVGIYVGNGQMINAPHTGADVRVDQVFGPGGKPLWGNFVGATRPADPTGTTTAPPGSQAQQGIASGQQNYGSILQEVIDQMATLTRTQREKAQAALEGVATP